MQVIDNTVKCPIAGELENQEVELFTIIDIESINGSNPNKVKNVNKVLSYIINNPLLPETIIMNKFLKQGLNHNIYRAYNQILKNYDNETKQFKRYYLIKDDSEAFSLFDAYNAIYGLIGTLQNITIEQIKKRKEM